MENLADERLEIFTQINRHIFFVQGKTILIHGNEVHSVPSTLIP